jgi:hypothetical protein
MAIRFEPKPVEEQKAEAKHPKQGTPRETTAASSERPAETAELPFDKPAKPSRAKPKR